MSTSNPSRLTCHPYQFNAQRNSVSLGIRMRWGMRNGIFHVAKEEGSDKVLGVAMWLRPQPATQAPTWNDWLEGWRLYFGQVAMNLYYGRGGLNVKVRSHLILDFGSTSTTLPLLILSDDQ